MTTAAKLKPGRYHLPLKSERGRITRWSAPVVVERIGTLFPEHPAMCEVLVWIAGGRHLLLPPSAPCAEATT